MASGDMQNMGKPAPSDAKSTSVPKGYPELRDELQERKAHTLARLHIRVHTSAHSKRERSKKAHTSSPAMVHAGHDGAQVRKLRLLHLSHDPHSRRLLRCF